MKYSGEAGFAVALIALVVGCVLCLSLMSCSDISLRSINRVTKNLILLEHAT